MFEKKPDLKAETGKSELNSRNGAGDYHPKLVIVRIPNECACVPVHCTNKNLVCIANEDEHILILNAYIPCMYHTLVWNTSSTLPPSLTLLII